MEEEKRKEPERRCSRLREPSLSPFADGTGRRGARALKKQRASLLPSTKELSFPLNRLAAALLVSDVSFCLSDAR